MVSHTSVYWFKWLLLLLILNWRLFAGISGIMFINVSTMKIKCTDTPRSNAFVLSFISNSERKTSYVGPSVCGWALIVDVGISFVNVWCTYLLWAFVIFSNRTKKNRKRDLIKFSFLAIFFFVFFLVLFNLYSVSCCALFQMNFGHWMFNIHAELAKFEYQTFHKLSSYLWAQLHNKIFFLHFSSGWCII